jgi:5-methylcytosine-specific restriction enzyme A
MKPLPFYKSRAWQRARRQALHDAGYRCVRCGGLLAGKGRGAHVHHRKPYLTAPALGTEPLNLTPLCVSCHDIVHHEMKSKAQCDIDGLPLDVTHPWFDAIIDN